jgi:hypothetical protein
MIRFAIRAEARESVQRQSEQSAWEFPDGPRRGVQSAVLLLNLVLYPRAGQRHELVLAVPAR